MTHVNRRNFLKAAASLAALPLPLREALAVPAYRRSGTIQDVQYVVILMQENRSFDHYFGCLKGVRGFGDPRPLMLPSGKSVFHQPAGGGTAETVLPFRLDSATTSAERMLSLDHSWKGQFNLWKHHDAWVPVKTPLTMGYFERQDIPFYYALADAFTVCDAYHCSVFGPTGPNRLFLFSGTSGLAANSPGPQATENIDDGNWTSDAAADKADFQGFTWTTYAERLEQAGVSWKVYQELDNFGDNPLSSFKNFRGLDQSSSLYRRGRAWTNGPAPDAAVKSFGQNLVAAFARDVAADALPQVSWIVAPTAASEHPEAPPSIGEAFTAGMLSALAAHPDVWAKTVFILNYDENDGFFDHVPPPVPAIKPKFGASTVATTGEALSGEPFGLGPRVPAIVVSPWTRGGWVNSQVFDHTSVIRFLEARFGVAEPNITAWRRAITGDLTSLFDFAKPDDKSLSVPSVDGLVERMITSSKLAEPSPPDVPSLPRQEPGHRPARPLPYRFAVKERVGSDIALTFENSGAAGVCFQVVAKGALQAGPWFYTVEAGKTLPASLPKTAGHYDLSIFGPNGFFRQLRGAGTATLSVEARHEADDLVLTLINDGTSAIEIEIGANAYGPAERRRYHLQPGGQREDRRSIAASGHWYDVIVSVTGDPAYLRRLAGHWETGLPSISDPAIGVN